MECSPAPKKREEGDARNLTARTHPIHEVKIFHEVRTVQDQPEILDGTAVVQLELNYVNMPSPAKAFEVLESEAMISRGVTPKCALQ